MFKREISKDLISKIIVGLTIIFLIIGIFTVQKSLIEGEPLKALGSQSN